MNLNILKINTRLIIILSMSLFLSHHSTSYGDISTNDVINIERTIEGTDFIWSFTCSGAGCYYGKFIGGERWIAPKSHNVEITLKSVFPDKNNDGLMFNPSSAKYQGLLKCQKESYKENLNIMKSIPIVVPINTSLVKTSSRSNSCGTKSINKCCVDSYDIVTVLNERPTIGKPSFRPAIASTVKKVYYLSDFNFSLIPKFYLLNKKKYNINYQEIHQRWHAAYVDHYMTELGDKGRAFTPHSLLPDYGAEQASLYINDLLAIMSNDSLEEKLPAITGLLQRGIDLYGSWKNGIAWKSGAGQQMGRKPPIVFFASLLNDEQIKEEVRLITVNNPNATQEDGQIRKLPPPQGGNIAIWGDTGQGCKEDAYWSQLYFSKNYDGSIEPYNKSGDTKKTCGDPYGFIDGPAGKPGTYYMSCCSTGGFIGYSVAKNIMPEMCDVSNDSEITEYARRILTKGIHTQPDPCAPPDPRESTQCKPFKKNAPGCQYYNITWGPDLTKPGYCIKNGVNNSKQSGRFPSLHGVKLMNIYNEPPISRYLRTLTRNTILDSCY